MWSRRLGLETVSTRTSSPHGLVQVLCLVVFIRLTSSQSTHDVIQRDSDVSRCGGTDQMLSGMRSDISQMKTALTQLQRDVAQLRPDSQLKNCPENFTHVPSVNGCYTVVSEKLEWSVAGLRCRSLHKDAHLLVISDALEQNAVAAWLANITQSTDLCWYDAVRLRRHTFWTAGQRIDPARESAFIWRMTGTRPSDQVEAYMAYTNWSPGEPNYDRGLPDSSCMHMWSLGSYTWNDDQCTVMQCAVCELDLSD